MKSFNGHLAAGLLLILSGCATAPTQQPFNRAATPVRTIGLLTPAMPSEFTVNIAVPAGASFGLLGALVDAGVQSSAEGKFRDAMAAKGIDIKSMGNAVVAVIVQRLQAQGYEVRTVPVTRPKPGLLEQYPPVDASIDALLDLSVGMIGYQSAGATTPYRPTIGLACKLVSTRNNGVLMQDAVIYNPFGQPANAVTLPANPDYQFPGIGDLSAQRDRAADGLKVATSATATALAQLLR